MWYDYDLQNDKSRKYFFPSNLFPLWADCYDPSKRDEMANSAIKYLRKTGAIRCKGGVPTSMNDSGQQWDFPNAWPPLQHILVAGKNSTQKILNFALRYRILSYKTLQKTGLFGSWPVYMVNCYFYRYPERY